MVPAGSEGSWPCWQYELACRAGEVREQIRQPQGKKSPQIVRAEVSLGAGKLFSKRRGPSPCLPGGGCKGAACLAADQTQLMSLSLHLRFEAEEQKYLADAGFYIPVQIPTLAFSAFLASSLNHRLSSCKELLYESA